MSVRLVALDEGSDIALDREMLVVGRHPQCDARLDSIRVSRRHCCIMTPDQGEIIVKDLGSTNGIRINGQRVEKGRLRPGDELSIAHIRYRFEDGIGQEMTMAEPVGERSNGHRAENAAEKPPMFRIRSPLVTGTPPDSHDVMAGDDNPLAAAVRGLLPAAVADKCRIQVIVQMPADISAVAAQAEDSDSCPPDSSL